MVYFLKINVAIALFYAFYRLFFYKDTFFVWRRTALLCFFAVSAVVPLFNIQTWVERQEPMVAVADLYATVVLPEITPTVQTETDRKLLMADGIGMAYWAVAVLLAVRCLVQLAGIVRLARRCPTQKIDGTTVHLLPRPEGPFSFFHWIFVCPGTHTAEELHEILTHECTHARQWHSIDVLIGELACIVCWFNPFAWLMKREIRTNLEYLADEKVLETGHDSRTYQYHLLGLSHHKAAATIYNSFNVLPLKKRIMMMNKRRTRAIGRTKYLMFLPLAALLMIVSNIEAVARATQRITAEVFETVTPAETPEAQLWAPSTQQEKTELVTYKGKIVDEAGNPIGKVRIIIDQKFQSVTTSTVNAQGEFHIVTSPQASILFEHAKGDGSMLMRWCTPEFLAQMDSKKMVIELIPANITHSTADDEIYEVVENMPRFPNGGMQALMQYLNENIRYPEAAIKAGVQGRVTLQFIVDKDGSIDDVKILRSVNPDLDAEAIRVIKMMPRWEPGTHKGKPVRVKYTVPVMFRIPSEPVEKIDEMIVVGYRTPDAPVTGEVYEVADKMPEFPGGMTGLMQYLSKNVKYPADARAKGIQGRVVVSVIVNTKGKATNATIVQSVSPSLDAEALRVAGTMPDWTPGTKDGTPVNVKYSFPITFRLQ
ncbi:M56 family metallopeptidase [Mediterranea massiliensis]|uniref:M56 family metallopeptidase n=1 Tax=Mediterranea massiliensis TaxID=1841865 RepID=UPI0009341CCD|nr:M56 family metallopeptidase [Mediterranea massiliensis]